MEYLNSNWEVNFWTIVFAIIPLILANLVLFIPNQRLILIGFFLISLIVSLFFFYINKISKNENQISLVQKNLIELSGEVKEKFNYLTEFYNLKMRVTMLEKKRGQIDLLDLFKGIVAISLIYVIFEIVKSA